VSAAFDPLQQNESGIFARNAIRSVSLGARSNVVNRTHRVVRQRAKVMREKRSRDRSVMAPLLICSVLLILSVLAVWTGLYEYQAVEATEADLAAIASADLSNHLMVVLLWFVPVSLALLATVWVRRSRENSDTEAL
jgi:cytochrome bd-type quinol oxidase subunit 2